MAVAMTSSVFCSVIMEAAIPVGFNVLQSCKKISEKKRTQKKKTVPTDLNSEDVFVRSDVGF